MVTRPGPPAQLGLPGQFAPEPGDPGVVGDDRAPGGPGVQAPASGLVPLAPDQSGSSIALTYEGATNEVASDGSCSYSRDPAGRITGVNSAAGGRLLALVDGHEDLSATFTAAGGSLSGSTVYDPWGQVLAASGPAVQVGYQGQWTDPGTGQTDMGARMYRPARWRMGRRHWPRR